MTQEWMTSANAPVLIGFCICMENCSGSAVSPWHLGIRDGRGSAFPAAVAKSATIRGAPTDIVWFGRRRALHLDSVVAGGASGRTISSAASERVAWFHPAAGFVRIAARKPVVVVGSLIWIPRVLPGIHRSVEWTGYSRSVPTGRGNCCPESP